MANQSVTFEEGLNIWFGGIAKLNKSPLPFICKCKGKMMKLADCFEHIRTVHQQPLNNKQEKLDK